MLQETSIAVEASAECWSHSNLQHPAHPNNHPRHLPSRKAHNLRPATAAAPSSTAAAAGPVGEVKGQKKRKRADADSDQAVIQGKGDVIVEPRAAVRLPTPHYNTSIIADMMIDDHQQALQSATDAIPKLSEAFVLLKV